MNKILWPMLVAFTLSACGTTGGTHATVEDRTGGTASTGQGTETTGVGGSGVAGNAMGDQYAGDPRKNPASPLSKRSVFFDYDSFVVKAEYRPMLVAMLMLAQPAWAARFGNDEEVTRQMQALQQRVDALDSRLAKLEQSIQQNQSMLDMLKDVEALKAEE